MFKIPIIPPDLRHEETIIQAAYALDCLQTTISTIFVRIDKRIEKNNVKVNELLERIKKSQDKINNLQGSRKSIRIYAPARFPATNIFQDLPVTFNEEEKQDLKSVAKYQVESKLDTNLPSLNDKLVFFHVRDENTEINTSEGSLVKERYNIKQNQDLGNMPPDLKSVSSVLLFDTNLSAYNLEECDSETSGQSEAWKRARLLRNKRQHGNYQSVSAKQVLDPAPHSLVHRRNEMLTPSGGLKYTPKLSEAPELNLPLDLPDLPGIADDLRYDSPEAKQKIAPSLAFVVENLPELKELLKDSDENQHISESRTQDSIPNSVPPPPPPPMPREQFTAPPPPPPPPTREFRVAQLKNNVSNADSVSPTSSDTRSELMAAIRNAGGIGKALLRPTAAAPLIRKNSDVVDNTSSATKKASAPRNSQGGDLMADLHNKLLMRRKGISGAKEDKNNTSGMKDINNIIRTDKPSGNPVISRLSALIPPPPATQLKARKTGTTSEEEDEDDSNDTDWVD